MGRQVAPRQQTGVDGRVQRLHAPVQDFGEAGDVGNAFDRKSRPGQRLLGAAGGEYLKAQPPPVENISKPSPARPLARLTAPALSDTLIMALIAFLLVLILCSGGSLP
jgi:hypothetical protein